MESLRIADACAAPTGTKGVAFAMMRRRHRRTAKDGRPYWDLELVDASGTADAKIWSGRDSAQAFDTAAAVEPGAAVKIGFVVDEFRGHTQLSVRKLRVIESGDEGFDPVTIWGDVPEWLPELRCETLVFDIETVPATELRGLPQTIVKTLTEHAERRELDQAAVMGLSPFFGRVVTLAFGDGETEPEEQRVTVLAVPPDGSDADDLPPWIRPVSEPELLRSFWTLATFAELVVSFNGRGFDVPFLIGRSLVHGIDARVDLVSKPFELRPHLDLFDVVGQRGRGPANLDVVCWALGIASPKGEMDGSMVAPAYARGELDKIATYNREDVRATTAVYRRVRERVLRFRRDWG